MVAEPVDRRKRFVTNSLYGLLSWLLPIIPTFVATPIVIGRLGGEQYGVLVLILGFISYFFTTAIGKVAAKYVAEYRAAGETEKVSAVISATLVLGVSITVAGSLLTAALARPIVVHILQIQAELQDRAVVGLYIAAATMVPLVAGQVFQLVLQGIHRFDRYLLLANLSSMSFSIGSIALVLAGYGLVGLLWWNFATWLMICVLAYRAVKKDLPAFTFTLRIPREIMRLVAFYAASIVAYQIFGNVLLIFERTWIMRQFGGEALTFYVVPMTLAMFVHLFISSLVLAMFPTVNELLTTPEKLGILYRRVTKLVLTLLVFALLSVIVCGKTFLAVWLGEDYAANSYALLVIHTITFTILALNTIAWLIADSFRAASLNAWATFFWMAVGIALMIVLGQTMETRGVAIGRLAGVIVFLPLIFYVEKRCLGGIFWGFWGNVTGRLTVAAIPAVIVEFLITTAMPRSWFGFVTAVAAGFFTFFAVLVLIRFPDDEERRLALSLISRKFRSGTADS